jgi:hypothetical protein
VEPERAGLVSVVVIFRNEARFLEEAIASVHAQTYPSWELLLVDDCSDDGSAQIAMARAARDPARVRYHTHPGYANRGMSASRNLGARHARGEHIALLDGDDAWLPRRLERSVAILARHPMAMMCYGTTQYWYSWQGAEAPERDRIQPHHFRANRVVQAPELLIRFLTHRAALPGTNSLLIRRRAFLDVGGFEESFPGLAEDQAFLAKFCLRHPVYVHDECLDRYRQHDDSCCAVAVRAGEVRDGQLRYLEWLEAHIRAIGCADSRVWKALQHQHRVMERPRNGRVRAALRAALGVTGIR